MQSITITAMILAGGIGERLFPMTCRRAKPVVPFGGSFRIIDFTLMNCMCSEIRRIHMLTQYHTQSLHRHHLERWNFLPSELDEYIEIAPPKMRGSRSLYQGTADAVYRNLEILDRQRPDVVLILSGDHIYRADYRRFIDAHVASGAGATVLSSTVPAPEASCFGVLSIDGEQRLTGFVEKPADPRPHARDGRCTINLGVYCFDTQFLVRLLVADSRRRTSHDFGKDILPAALKTGGLHACGLEQVCPDAEPYWRDVGDIDSYFDANMDLLRAVPPFALKDPRWPPHSRFHHWVPARIAAAARMGRRSVQGRNLVANGCDNASAEVVNCILSPRVAIAPGAQLEECILFPGAVVGEGARLRRVIVEEGVHVPPGLRITSGRARGSKSFTVSPRGVVVMASDGEAVRAPQARPADLAAAPA